MDDLRIRPAATVDAAGLARVYRSAYAENRRLGFPAKAESATADDVAAWIREHAVFVATVDREVVGGVRLEETEPGRVKLSRLGVHERWKGKGIGSRLLDRAEAAARDHGYDAVWLTTPPDHPSLPDLYRERGYVAVGEYPLAYREYDEVRMEKSLESA